MAERCSDAGPSNRIMDDSLEQSLGITSETFDPMRLLYSANLELSENVEIYSSVSQFVKNVNLESSASLVTTEVDHESVELDRTLSRTLRSTADVLKTEIASESHQTHSIPPSTTQSVSPHPETFINKIESKDVNTPDESTKGASEDVDVSDRASDSLTATSDGDTTEEATKKTTTRPRKVRRTVLTEMTTGFQVGPLSILRRSVEEKLKVRVLTRSIRGIRGISTGYIVAFDKHMNLAMMDVDELYRKPVGKHQKKAKKPDEELSLKTEEMSEEDTEELCYPKAPWQKVISTGDEAALSGSSGNGNFATDRDEIEDLLSAFSGSHFFSENETTRLLGAKARRLQVRHLNQVLLRGDSVVAVALAE